MTKPTGQVAQGNVTDIEWSGFEDFSSFELGAKIESGTFYTPPSGIGFRVNHEAGSSFLPDAHITSEEGQRGLAIMLGALEYPAPENPGVIYRSNSIEFDFPMHRIRDVEQIGITFNSRFEGVRLWFSGWELSPDYDPYNPTGYFFSASSVKGETTVITSKKPVRVNIINLIMQVSLSPMNINELPVTIKRVSWLLGNEGGRQE